MPKLTINQRFLDKYNYLDALVSDLLQPREMKGPSPMVIFEKIIPEPHSIHLQTIRKTRNILVHSKRLSGSQPFIVSEKVEHYLDEMLTFVKTNKKDLKNRYQVNRKKYLNKSKKISYKKPKSQKQKPEIKAEKSTAFKVADEDVKRQHYKKGPLSYEEKKLVKHMTKMAKTQYRDEAFDLLSIYNASLARKLVDSILPFSKSVYYHLGIELLIAMSEEERNDLLKQFSNRFES